MIYLLSSSAVVVERAENAAFACATKSLGTILQFWFRYCLLIIDAPMKAKTIFEKPNVDIAAMNDIAA